MRLTRVPSRPRLALLAAGAALAVGGGWTVPAVAAPQPAGAAAVVHDCGTPTPGRAACAAQHLAAAGPSSGSPAARSAAGAALTPDGYAPADLRQAYFLTTASATRGSGQTIAIVDAYDNPNAEADLAVYRDQYGLPPCTTDGGCFQKVNGSGAGAPLPAGDTGWGAEIDLDLQMASAICPNCSLLLVEAASNTFADLGVAVRTAAAMGAQVISNSYYGSDFGATDTASPYYQPGHMVVVASGDSGYGPTYPASSPYVTAVGGTQLNRATTNRGFKEVAWSGAGSGCSMLNVKPSWQTDTGCDGRSIADVAAVADPSTGVAVYDSYGASGWLVYGGTSVSAPIVAGLYALAGNADTVSVGSALYAHPKSLIDVIRGANGTCTPTYLCTAQRGYDGPTGLGTPHGVGAF